MEGWPGMRFLQPSLLMKPITYLPAQQKVSQFPPQWCEDIKKRAPFFPLGALHVGWDNPSTRRSWLSWTSSCSAQLLLMACWDRWFPTKKLGLSVHTIAQGWSMNLMRGARVSMSSLIYDQTPLIKGKAIQFYHLGVSLNGGTPKNTPKWSFLVEKPMVVGYQHFRNPPIYTLLGETTDTPTTQWDPSGTHSNDISWAFFSKKKTQHTRHKQHPPQKNILFKEVLLIEEILHHLIGSLSRYSQGFIHFSISGGAWFLPSTVSLISFNLNFQRNTLPETNISPGKVNFEDDFPFPKAGYVSSLEGMNYPSSPSSRLPNWAESIMPLLHFSLLDRELDEPEKSSKGFPSQTTWY